MSDGQFGDLEAPVFLDNLDCMGSESRLLDCDISAGHLGLIDDTCGLDLGVICPGMYILSLFLVHSVTIIYLPVAFSATLVFSIPNLCICKFFSGRQLHHWSS